MKPIYLSLSAIVLFGLVACAPQQDPEMAEKTDALSASDEALKAQAEAMEARLEKLEKRIATLEGKSPDLERKIDQARSSLNGMTRVNNSLESRIGNLESEVFHKLQLEQIAALYPDATATESGLHYIVTQAGEGEATPEKGQKVKAHYTGTLLDGSKFDSSLDRGRPFEFNVGLGRVIKGWDEAFLSMAKGEKRTLIIPSKIAYGAREIPGSIPANSILVFDVELLDFE